MSSHTYTQKFIKSLKKIFYDFYISFTFKKIVHSSDKSNSNIFEKTTNSDSQIDLLKKNGVLVYNMDYINDDMVNPYLSSFDNRINLNSFDESPVINIPFLHEKNSLVEKILSDEKLIILIKHYLGNDAKLDLISVNSTCLNSIKQIVSEKWHYDNVGRRVKMFVYFNNSSKISTDYILGTNNIYHKNYSTDGSRIKFAKIKSLENKTKSFYPVKFQSIIFDTNGYHRGRFTSEKNFNERDKLELRNMIKFEFSSEAKSEKFFGKSDAIGPRNTFFSDKFNFNNCPLINKKYLTKIDNFLYYSKLFSENY
ncbi:MAG: hypothetical protein ACJZ4G_02000 [Candidatus Pelagibacter sp.]